MCRASTEAQPKLLWRPRNAVTVERRRHRMVYANYDTGRNEVFKLALGHVRALPPPIPQTL